MAPPLTRCQRSWKFVIHRGAGIRQTEGAHEAPHEGSRLCWQSACVQGQGEPVFASRQSDEQNSLPGSAGHVQRGFAHDFVAMIRPLLTQARKSSRTRPSGLSPHVFIPAAFARSRIPVPGSNGLSINKQHHYRSDHGRQRADQIRTLIPSKKETKKSTRERACDT
jgi:hypothetical protein